MLLAAETDFGLSLLQQNPVNESLVFSPLSIALALSLVHLGANGSTKQQIGDAICKGASDEEMHEHFQNLTKSFTTPSNGVEVDLANRMFIRNGFEMEQSYLSAIRTKYDAEAVNLDFAKSEESAGVMNTFVNETTHGKINKLVESRQVKDAVAILINALYLKADWKVPFYPESTKHDQDFYQEEGKTRKVSYMGASDVYHSYMETEEVQVLSLSYRDRAYAFNIFLPKEKFGLAAFRDSLTGAKMQQLLSQLKSTYVTIHIPKMKIETELEATPMLKKLNITEVFGDKADLSGISKKAIAVSNVVHKALIEVDEMGTVAAAATMVKFVKKMGGPMIDPTEFSATHPFLFSLTFDNHPVFLGIYA